MVHLLVVLNRRVLRKHIRRLLRIATAAGEEPP